MPLITALYFYEVWLHLEHVCNLITRRKERTDKSGIRACAAFLITRERNQPGHRFVSRGAVETEWVVMVWTVMLVHDD